jgi:hypothetical protein
MKKTSSLILALAFSATLHAQEDTTLKHERDIIDVGLGVLGKQRKLEQPDKTAKQFSVVPALGYTLQTGFAAILSGNVAFYTDTTPKSRLSFVSTSITYSQYNQIIVPVVANIWLDGDKWNLITDFRYIKYPSDIYGLGGPASPDTGYTVNFSGIKFHQTVMRKLGGRSYAGVGYYYDKFYNIEPSKGLSEVIAEQVRKKMGTSEMASGYVLRFLYDNRKNPINSNQGIFFNATFRDNLKALGSKTVWSSLQLDARTYVRFPSNSNNVLALWTFHWLTTGGETPFLMLPSNGWDDNYNTGRGYIQGRFRGKNMHYLEAEYRYRITRNGLIGGVVFANVQKFSDDLSESYANLQPGYGLGLRIKLNKYSGTNLCIDYGFGSNGSRGFFVNLAEVF